jgi:hypothetical protein
VIFMFLLLRKLKTLIPLNMDPEKNVCLRMTIFLNRQVNNFVVIFAYWGFILELWTSEDVSSPLLEATSFSQRWALDIFFNIRYRRFDESMLF